MSFYRTLDAGMPTETAAVADAPSPRGHAYLGRRHVFGPIYADAQFADRFARDDLCDLPFAAGARHAAAVRREPIRPSCRRRHARPNRMEVPSWVCPD